MEAWSTGGGCRPSRLAVGSSPVPDVPTDRPPRPGRPGRHCTEEQLRRTSRPRAIAATGLTHGLAATGLALAPSASAADANGVVTVELTVPAGTPLGNHTLAYDGAQGTHVEVPLQLTADGKALASTGASTTGPLVTGGLLLAAGAGALAIGCRRTVGAAQV